MGEEKEIRLNSIHLEADFLESYLKDTSAEALKVYIFLRSAGQVTVNSIAKGLGLSVTEVENSITFWTDKGLLEETNGVLKLRESNKPKRKIRFDERPEYDPVELQMYKENNDDVQQLFSITEQHLGRTLTHNDLSGVFSIYHWLGLNIEVIDKLLGYCVENNHRNMRYIEKVALDWAENNITTIHDVEEKLRMYNVDFRCIMKAMGQSSRNPISKEEQYMVSWLKEMKMPLDVIVLACERTVLNTGKAAFSYANKILSSWKENGVQSTEEAMALEERFNKNKKETPTKQASVSKNKFVNFEQRNYDFESYERMELERLKGQK